MERGFDVGVAVVPDVNARVSRETSPGAVPVGRGGPTVAGVGTGEGMILPPQSERWLSSIFRAIPSTQRIRRFIRTPEILIVLLGPASLISLIIFIFDAITTKSFRPLTVAVFFSAGGYCVLLIQRPRFLNAADQVLAEIMEARAMDTSKRFIPQEERRSLLHYFTLRLPTPLESAFSCEDAPFGASIPAGTSTHSGDGDGRGAEGFFRKALVQSSSDGEEARRAQCDHLRNANVPPRDGPLGEETPREEEGVSAGDCSADDAIAGCSRDRHACSAPEERGKDGKKGEALRRASWKWGTGEQCVVCFEEYSYGEDLCQLPCYHMFHAECIGDWLNGANHNWCPVCKKSVLGDDHDQETSEDGGGMYGEAV